MFPNDAAEFVYTRTYSRWLEEEKRRGFWPETVKRYLDFIKEERGSLIPSKVLRKMEEKILNFEVMPSMRAIWASGSAAKSDNLTMYNCSFAAIQNISAFAEAFYILLCGTGYGFSVERQYISKLPIIQPLNSFHERKKFIISDDKKGWADSIKFLIESLYQGIDVDFDYSVIRPKGSRLITMGGRASGPDPLIVLHSFIREVFQNAQGRKLHSIECHDILNQIAEAVIVAGVRRSSEISLSDLDDEMMRNAKQWPFPPRRYMANNSAMYHVKPNAVDFLKEWSILASSGTGERGIINLYSAHKNAPKRRDKTLILGTNPCVTGDTLVAVADGRNHVTFDKLTQEGKDVPVYCLNDSGQPIIRMMRNPRITGYNLPIYKITLDDGNILKATANHKFLTKDNIYVEVKDLKINESLLMMGKRQEPNPKHLNWKIQCNDYNIAEHRLIAEFYNDTQLSSSFERTAIELSIEDKKIRLISDPKSRRLYRTLLKHGYNLQIKNGKIIVIKKCHTCNKKIELIASQREVMYCSTACVNKGRTKKSYKLSEKKISQSSKKKHIKIKQIEQFKRLQKELNRIPYKKEWINLCKKNRISSEISRPSSPFKSWNDLISASENFNHKVINIEFIGYENVYNGTVDEFHNYFVGGFNGISRKNQYKKFLYVNNMNCGEILLRDKQLCNLSEVVIKSNDDMDDLLEKVETATWIGAIQSTFTYFPYLSKEWKKNCEEERLLGVSLTGQMDNPKILSDDALRILKNKAIKIAKKASDILKINMPTAITCTKPSGTVSQVVDSASGIHPRFAKYYIRRYRISSNDPLFKMIKDQGIKYSPENGQENLPEDQITTYIVSFPIKAPKHSIIKDEMTAIDQLEWYKKIQTNWCEHNASMTVYVKDEEWFEVGNWVYKNWDIINGVSFLPFDGGKYKQAPYEEITEEKYTKLIENFKKIDYSKLTKYEQEDNTEGSKSLACTGDKCDIT